MAIMIPALPTSERTSAVGAGSDEAWMHRYVEGDVSALPLLFERYAQRIHSYFFRALGDRALADDLLQTTFLKLHVSRASFDTNMPFRPWIYAIANRVRIDALRRRYRERATTEVSLNALTDENEPRSEVNDVGLELLALRRALSRLSDAQQTLIHLHRFEELSFAEMAVFLSQSEGREVREGTVRVRTFRAYEALREILMDSKEKAPAYD